LSELSNALAANPYPGRILLVARTGDGVLAGLYALTGRSKSSKQRRIVQTSADELRVVAVGDQEHDSLRHYVAGLSNERWTVFGNGEQVPVVFERLRAGSPPALALDDLEYEPDPPIYTPRITAVVDRSEGTVWLGAARRSGGHRESTDVTVTTVRGLAVGDVVMLSTYVSDGREVRMSGQPVDLRTGAASGVALLDEVWTALDRQYAVAAALLDPAAGVGATLRQV
jgi:IMP cyclohydrolase